MRPAEITIDGTPTPRGLAVLWTLNALEDAVAGGAGADLEHPAAARARSLTAQLGCAWDFTTWEEALACAQAGQLGGVDLSEPK